VGYRNSCPTPLGKLADERFWSSTITPEEWCTYYAIILAENHIDFSQIEEDKSVVAKIEEYAHGGILYLIDNVLFGSSVALKSYLRKIASKEDLTGCLSFGMTANHVTAIVIPIIGGVAWVTFGYEATFVAGAVIVLIDMQIQLQSEHHVHVHSVL
jgi:hypothetical protein